MYAFNATSPKLAELFVPTIENTTSFSVTVAFQNQCHRGKRNFRAGKAVQHHDALLLGNGRQRGQDQGASR